MTILSKADVDKVAQKELLREYLPTIKRRVVMSEIKDQPLYNIYGEYYEFYRILEDEKTISFLFQHAYDKNAPLQQIKCRKISKYVMYNSFTSEKFILTDEEKKMKISEYNKKYYNEKTIDKRNKAREEKKLKPKICVVCGKEFFNPSHKANTCSDECRAERARQMNKKYKETHKEQLKEKAKEWAKNHPDRIKQIAKKYHSTEKWKTTYKKYLQSKKGQLALKRNLEKQLEKLNAKLATFEE